MPINPNIRWGSPEFEARYIKRMAEVDAEDWIRAYDNPPEHDQDVIYTFPEWNESVFIGKYDGSEYVDKYDGNTYTAHTFYSKAGFLGDEDVYWKPWPPIEED
jgi:phage terminase large subunit